MENQIVFTHFKIKQRIGSGSFGEVYSCEDTKSHEQVAAKLENMYRKSDPQLELEARIYRKLSGSVEVPKFYHFGNENRYNIMIIEMLGKSLEKIINEKQHVPFSLKTVLMLVDQMITCIEYLHRSNFIHRDIKPDNFLMGINRRENQVMVIDFGLSKQYRDPDTGLHIPCQKTNNMTGTARYASLNAMRGIEQSRRDDMEALGYVFIYLLKGKLPWQGIPAHDQTQKLAKIYEAKRKTSIEELSHEIPKQFGDYLSKVRKLEFDEEPAYAEYREMFRTLFKDQGYKFDYQYDWTEPNSVLVNHCYKLTSKSTSNVKEDKFSVRPPPNELRVSFSRRMRNYKQRRESINIKPVKIEKPNPRFPLQRQKTVGYLPKINRPQVHLKVFYNRRYEQHSDKVE